jgi:AcrR family transcriptional regulator
MHKLAISLGVSTMALYTYFPSRESLLEQVADEFIGLVPIPPPSYGPWQERISEHQRAVARGLAIHPGLLSIIATRQTFHALGPQGRQSRIDLLTVLLDAGFDEAEAAQTHAALTTLMKGYLETQAETGPASTRRSDESSEDRHVRPGPAVERSATILDRLEPFDRYRGGLELLLEALTYRLHGRSRTPERERRQSGTGVDALSPVTRSRRTRPN